MPAANMAARVSSVSREMFSCSVLPSLRTICASLRPKALEFNNKIIKKTSLYVQASKFSTYNFQASVWNSRTHVMRCSSWQPHGFQNIYPLHFTAHCAKQIELSYKSCFTVITRGINTKSKLGKRKTCKAVAARFLRTGKGKLKRWRAGKNHKMMNKGPKRSRHLRKPTYVNKQQLKLLNKMLNGW